MEKLTFDYIREHGLLLFEYIRGSKLYHTDTPESDEDHGGVYISPADFGFELCQEVADEKNDTKWWELGKFMKLTLTANPSVLEAFFVPDDLVLFEHPLFKEIRSHRDEFITKACFKPFGSYSVSQIKKAQGQNKKIHWDVEDMKRKTPLDFCFTYDGRQGSLNIQEFLSRHGLRQDCCGCVNLSNMRDNYLVYYDFAQHMRLSDTTLKKEAVELTPFFNFMANHFLEEKTKKGMDKVNLYKYIEEMTAKPYGGHCGIINNEGTSNAVRLCSTDKKETPICMMCYNLDGYGSHCRKYKEYEEWKQKRNKARYESNLSGEMSGNPDMKYDCKNMYHSFRNVAMCTEIAQGKGLILDRTGIDRDFLMDVRNRKYGFSELNAILVKRVDEMNEAIEKSTIPDSVSEEFVYNLTKETRRKFLKM